MSRLCLVLVLGLSMVLGGCGSKDETSDKPEKEPTPKEWFADLTSTMDKVELNSFPSESAYEAKRESIFAEKYKAKPFKFPVSYSEHAAKLLKDTPKTLGDCQLKYDGLIDCSGITTLQFDNVSSYKYEINVDCLGASGEIVKDNIYGFKVEIPSRKAGDKVRLTLKGINSCVDENGVGAKIKVECSTGYGSDKKCKAELNGETQASADKVPAVERAPAAKPTATTKRLPLPTPAAAIKPAAAAKRAPAAKHAR
jgi:hypothetical protein